MTHSSTTELEQEAEQRRAELTETAERLRAKLTPGQLLDEAVHTFRGGDWSTAATNLKTQVRDNPLGLLLVGAGIACMAAGVPSASRSRATRSDGSGGYGVGELASAASQEMHEAAGSISDGVASGKSTLSGFARDTGERTTDAARMIENEMANLLQREPLILGAVGLAIGAAIGALLPETRFEEEHLGPYEDRIRKAGAEAAKSAVGKAGDVAVAAGNAALDEADRHGLVSDQDAAQLKDRIGTVADRTLGKAQDVLSGAQPAAEPSRGSTGR